MLHEINGAKAHASARGAVLENVKGNGRPAVAELVPALLMLAKQMRAMQGIKLAATGLVAGQDQLLLAFDRDEPLAVSSLAEALSVRPSTVSKMVDRLVEKGLVGRSSDPSDSRKVCVRLTASGIAMQVRVQAVLRDFDAELVRALGDDADGVVATMSKLDGVLAARLRRLR